MMSTMVARVVDLPLPTVPGDQDQAARLHRQVADDRRQFEVVEAS